MFGKFKLFSHGVQNLATIRDRPLFRLPLFRESTVLIFLKIFLFTLKSPAPNPEQRTGKYYFCMMHLDENAVMMAGGRPGDQRPWEDKSFVYSWENGMEVSHGNWIGTKLQR